MPFTVMDLKKYFFASLILALISFVGAILTVTYSGEGNVLIETSVVSAGNGPVDLDIATYSTENRARAIANGAMWVGYNSRREFGVVGEDGGIGQIFNSSYTVSGAKGGYQNQYTVETSGGGDKQVWRATDINGDFAGELNADVSGDVHSLALMTGNAKYRGRITSGWSGRPVNEEEVDAIGNLTIRSYLVMDVPIKTSEDWLGFCASINKDVIKSEETGLYFVPDGWDVDQNGMLQRNMTWWQTNNTTKTLDLRPP